MNRLLVLALILTLAAPALAKEPDPKPRVGESPAQKVPPPTQPGLKPKISPGGPDLGPAGKSQVPLPPGPVKNPVPIEGRAVDDIQREVVRPPSLTPQVPGGGGIQQAMSNRLRVDGKGGVVDLRGSPSTVVRYDWQFAPTRQGLTMLLVRRGNARGCPRAGTAVDSLPRELESDPAVVEWMGWSNQSGSSQIDLSRNQYAGLTEVTLQVCGIEGNTTSGVASNVVLLRFGSVHQTAQLRVTRWSVEWSLATEANTVCGLGVDTAANPPPRGTPIGYASRIETASGPIPCVRDRLYVYQPSASFDLTSVPRGARIVSAALRFREDDLERRSESGRVCPIATTAVGMATGVVPSSNREVPAVSRSADAQRRLDPGSGRSHTIDVREWVEAWQRGRASGVTFLGGSPSRRGNACLAQLGDVRIDVEYE